MNYADVIVQKSYVLRYRLRVMTGKKKLYAPADSVARRNGL